MSNLYSGDGVGTGTRYLRGDTDPEDFNWEDVLTNSDLLNLLLRNGKIRKACAWVSREAVRPRFILKKDKTIKGTKFGKAITFDNVSEYLEWIGFFTELEKAYTWARLFGTSIMVTFLEGEGIKQIYEPLSTYDSCQAYYPLTSGNGYQIEEVKGQIYYKITFTDILLKTKTFYVHANRVVTFNAPHLELKYEGSSDIEPMAKICIVQEQMLRSFMKRIHMMGSGIAIMKCGGEDEKEILDASIGDGLKYIQKIYTMEDPETVLHMYTPDLNSNQFREIWDIAQEEVANDMNMSKKLISGDPQGAISSAKWDTEISYTEVYQTQRHYKKATEHMLFLLGIQDTTFNWNDPFPTEQVDQNNEGNQNGTRSNSEEGSTKARSDSAFNSTTNSSQN